jgi:hypothetical protein
MLFGTHVGVRPKQGPWGIGEQDVQRINSEHSEWAVIRIAAQTAFLQREL